MSGVSRRLTGVVSVSGLTLLLLPAPISHAQNNSPRSRSAAERQPAAAPAVETPAPPPQPLNMLQEPAHEAQVAFAGNQLSIHADNASLAAILRQVAAGSGMKITGLGSDERVFGSFGPGAPRDVLAELLNGTAYNQVLIGDSSNGAPRELILTPLGHAGAPAQAAAAPAQATPDEAVNDQENPDGPPPPDAAPPPSAAPGGVRTPQQLFEQLQRMRQAQQQQIPGSDQPQSQPPQ